jgi:long-chain fatty acid transport protein
LAVAAALGGAAGHAGAAGFQLIEQNASGLGNAYAGQAAAAEDASTIWFNPAGMTLLPGRQAVGALSAIRTSAKFQNSGGSTPPAAQSPITFSGDGGDAGGWGFVPNGYLSWQINDKLWAGIGVNAPFGLKTQYDDLWIGAGHAVKSEVAGLNINPSVAWKINEMFSVGGGVNAMYFDAELTKQANYSGAVVGLAGAGALPALATCAGSGATQRLPTGAGCFGYATVKGNDWAWGWNLGAMINFSPATRVGIAYRSAITIHLDGTNSFNNIPPAAFSGPLSGQLGRALANGDINSTIRLPQTVYLAASHQFDRRWQVLVDYTWTGWDSIQSLDINRSSGGLLSSEELNFKNSYRVGLGVNYQLTDQWKLRGGLAYDRTPVQDAYRTPRLPDNNRTWVALGAQYAASKELAFDFGAAYLFISDASSQLNNPLNANDRLNGFLVGNYKEYVYILGAQARYNF